MAFNMFPYSNLHRLNTDWVLEQIRNAAQAVQDAKEEVDAAVAVMEGYDEHLSILDQGVASNAGQIQTVASNLSTLAGTVATQGDRLNSINTGLTDLAGHAVQTYEQEFSDAEKAQARTNIGAVALSAYNTNNNRVNAILEYQGNQISALELSDTTQAGQISALQADTASVVKYTAQTLTEAQKLRARLNIGAAAGGDPSGGVLRANIVEDSQGNYTLDGMAPNELAEALLEDYQPVFVFLFPYDQSYVMSLTDLQARELASQNYMITGTALKNRIIYTVVIQIANDLASVTLETAPVDYPIRQGVTGTNVTISPLAGIFYECSNTVEDLQINTPGLDVYHRGWTVRFTTGNTAPRTIFPATIRGLESFAAEANTTYEINVLDNLAVIGSWAVSA